MGVRRAARSPWVERAARLGLVAKGVSYALVAVLAIDVIVGRGGETASRQGALRTVAAHPLGKVVLVPLAVGFAGYALWRLTDAVFDPSGEGSDAKGLAKRAGALARACLYAGLLVTTIEILAGAGGGSGGTKRETAGVLGWPAGRELVVAVGLGVAAAAVWNLYRGVSGKFEDKLEQAPGAARWTGTVGHCARGVVFGIVAWFLVKAAIEYDPKEAVGLDGALAKLAHQAYGEGLLGATAAGLLAYGVYCLFEARYREV
jgi:hypothetical protein